MVAALRLKTISETKFSPDDKALAIKTEIVEATAAFGEKLLSKVESVPHDVGASLP